MDGNLPSVPPLGAPPNVVDPQVYELEKQRDKHQFDIAVKNLEVILVNNREERAVFEGNRKSGFWLMILFSLLIFTFFMTALFMNKDAFIADMLKIIVSCLGGGGVGYVFGYRRGRNEAPNKPQS